MRMASPLTLTLSWGEREFGVFVFRQGTYVAESGVHTNGVENVWTLLKRSVTGTFHKISAKHLDAYLDKIEWRHNNRKNPYLFRDTMRKLIGAEKLEFKELITSA